MELFSCLNYFIKIILKAIKKSTTGEAKVVKDDKEKEKVKEKPKEQPKNNVKIYNLILKTKK